MFLQFVAGIGRVARNHDGVLAHRRCLEVEMVCADFVQGLQVRVDFFSVGTSARAVALPSFAH
jgi:hypothetical protein